MNEIVNSLNWLDYLLLGILVSSLVASLVRGFVREIAGLVALLLAILLGMWFHGAVGSFFVPYVAEPRIADWLGFGVIFFAITGLGGLAGFLIAKVVSVAGLSIFDRLLGGAFGLMKGALMGAIVVFALLAFTPKGPPESVSTSLVAPYVTWTADVLAAMAPRELRDAVERNLTALRDIWQQAPGLIPDMPGANVPTGADPQPAPPRSPSAKPSPNNAGLHSGNSPQAEKVC